MKKGIVILGAGLILLLIAGAAMAQVKSPAMIRTAYSAMDANGDGVVTVTEHAAFWQGRFREIDAENDGKLTAAEFNAAEKRFFGDMDTDDDGALLAKEYIAFWCGPKALEPAKSKTKTKTKKKLDANKNGKIGDDECVAFWVAEIYDVDANQDGKVTSEEYMAAMAAAFKEIDKDRNGLISIEEHAYFISKKAGAAKK